MSGGDIRRAVVAYMNSLDDELWVRPSTVAEHLSFEMGQRGNFQPKKMVRDDLAGLAKQGYVERKETGAYPNGHPVVLYRRTVPRIPEDTGRRAS